MPDYDVHAANHHPQRGSLQGNGLIDLLPTNVSKAHALAWWVDHARMMPDSIVFASDSGKELAALTAGYRAILVGKHRQKNRIGKWGGWGPNARNEHWAPQGVTSWGLAALDPHPYP
jgi:hypothetical protein